MDSGSPPVVGHYWLPDAEPEMPNFVAPLPGGREWEHFHNALIDIMEDALRHTARVDETLDYMASIIRTDSNRSRMFYSTLSFTRPVPEAFFMIDDWLFRLLRSAVIFK